MAEIKTYHNKRSILNRMLDVAASIQGVNRSELLDPVVTLFIESLAEEIYHLSADIDNLEARILNKLSSILVAETATVASPVHSLLHVSALKNIQTVTTTTDFSFKYKLNQRNYNLSLYPVCNTRIYNGDIRYFILNRYLYSIDKDLTKTLITRSGQLKNNENNSLWIGLELDESITNLKNLSFYLNLSNGYGHDEHLKELTHAKWKFQGQDIFISKGLYSENDSLENPNLDLFYRYDNSNRLNQAIKKVYDKYFITISQHLDISGRKEVLPKPLESIFPETVKGTIQKELIWFEIICPADFSEEIIRAIEISINIIPVSCKQLVKEVVHTNKYLPIIPLNTQEGESFLSVHSLQDSNGVSYYDIPLSDTQDTTYGIYSLRNGGYERFSPRDAKEFLANMTSLIDGEAASFFKRDSESKSEKSGLQTDVSRMLRDLRKASYSELGYEEVKNYLLLEQKHDNEIYFLKYWVTNSNVAGAVKENVSITPDSDLRIKPGSLYLLAPFTGGRQTPSQHEKYNQYKKSLVEHPLLVTADDIRQFCLKEFGEIAGRVEVKQGFEIDENYSGGFKKTTDVYLIRNQQQRKEIDKNYNQHIKQVLQEHSPATFNYRIIIK